MVREIEAADAAPLGALFHDYRVFYDLDSNIEECVGFISERIAQRDSTIFVACGTGGTPVAFAQMYPLFSEVTLKKIWLLNDLYVKESERRNGIAKRLMQRCEDFVRESGGTELTLATAKSNHAAQSLYEMLGYKRNSEFWVYNLYL
ncbi:MAG TPA: GNAT family N-acetyltransferase [Terriglobales bacterium]|nr:GNAT family N-acetyltransferase [Terriglobales bacterium]